MKPNTTEPTFTPGPWAFALDKDGPFEVFPARSERAASDNSDCIAIIDLDGTPDDRAEANARLIAASPDLYRTLQSTRDALVMALDEYEAAKMKYRSGYLTEVIAAIDKALAKATKASGK